MADKPYGNYEYLTLMAEKAHTGVPASVFYDMQEDDLEFDGAMEAFAARQQAKQDELFGVDELLDPEATVSTDPLTEDDPNDMFAYTDVGDEGEDWADEVLDDPIYDDVYSLLAGSGIMTPAEASEIAQSAAESGDLDDDPEDIEEVEPEWGNPSYSLAPRPDLFDDYDEQQDPEATFNPWDEGEDWAEEWEEDEEDDGFLGGLWKQAKKGLESIATASLTKTSQGRKALSQIASDENVSTALDGNSTIDAVVRDINEALADGANVEAIGKGVTSQTFAKKAQDQGFNVEQLIAEVLRSLEDVTGWTPTEKTQGVNITIPTGKGLVTVNVGGQSATDTKTPTAPATAPAPTMEDELEDIFGDTGGYWTQPTGSSGVRIWVPIGPQAPDFRPPMLKTADGVDDAGQPINLRDEGTITQIVGADGVKRWVLAPGKGTPVTPTTGIVSTVIGEVPEEYIPSYKDMFMRIFNMIPGSQAWEAQSRATDMFNMAENIFYMTEDWWKAPEGQDWEIDFEKLNTNDAAREIAKATDGFGNWVDRKWFPNLSALRFGKGFYDGVRGLRDRMEGIANDSMSKLYEKYRDDDTDTARRNLMDRWIYMEPNKASSGRLAHLVGMYNIHPGADGWLQNRMMRFYQNMMNNWVASGRTAYDFMNAFVKERPAMNGGDDDTDPEDLDNYNYV